MTTKNKSGKSPLFYLYEKKTPLFRKLGVLLIFVFQLIVMYIIQNNFYGVKFRTFGLMLLALSLIVSSLSVSLFLKQNKDSE